MKRFPLLFAAAMLMSCSDGETPAIPPGGKVQPGKFDPATLFTDRSCTELRAGVTQLQIDSCDVAVYHTIASQLLKGTYPAEFRILDVEPLPDPKTDAALNKTAEYGVMDNPTGISVASRDTLYVLVDHLPEGQKATLKIQSLSTTSNAMSYDNGPSYELANGENIIVPASLTGEGKGLGYIRYYYTGAKPSNIRINIYGGEVNGYFDSRKHTAADWNRILNGSSSNAYLDLVGEYSTITFPKTAYRQYVTDGAMALNVIAFYDRVVWLEWKFMGLLDPPLGFGGWHRTNGYFIYTPNVSPNASSYRTMYPDLNLVSFPYIISNSWVFGHEHGHVNQTRPAFRWVGLTETTNNIHSMYVYERLADHFPTSASRRENSRLQVGSNGGYANTYERAMNMYFGKDGPRPHNRNEGADHFCRLVPFWQLHLFMEATGKTGTHGSGFYEDIYEHYRKNDPAANQRSNGEHQLYFVELVCKTAKLDLTDFFTRMGFLLPINEVVGDYSSGTMMVSEAMIANTISTISKYPKPGRALEYITDGNAFIFKDRLAMQTGGGAEISKDGKFTGAPTGWTNAVAFEVRENDETGAIRCVFTNGGITPTFNGNGFIFNKELHRLYAVAHDGERREVTVTVAGTTPTPPQFTMGEGKRVLYINPVLKTDETWTLELTTTWTAENHVDERWGTSLLSSEENPDTDGRYSDFQYYLESAAVDPERVNIVLNYYTKWPKPDFSAPVTFGFTLECAGDGDIRITLKVNGNVVDDRRRIQSMTELELVSKNTNYEMQGTLTRN